MQAIHGVVGPRCPHDGRAVKNENIPHKRGVSCSLFQCLLLRDLRVCEIHFPGRLSIEKVTYFAGIACYRCDAPPPFSIS